MAISAHYDEYEDVGLAFTEEQVASYSIPAAAQERVDVVIRELHLLKRRTQIPDVPKFEWHQLAIKKLLPTVTWMVQVAGLEGRSAEEWLELPDSASAAGKALTKEAQLVEPLDWCAAGVQDVANALAFHVSITRRSGRFTRGADKSLSNKYANALVAQLRQMRRVQSALLSTVQAEGVKEEAE